MLYLRHNVSSVWGEYSGMDGVRRPLLVSRESTLNPCKSHTSASGGRAAATLVGPLTECGGGGVGGKAAVAVAVLAALPLGFTASRPPRFFSDKFLFSV